jgi:DNA-binding NarL/FixJ family response regulator
MSYITPKPKRVLIADDSSTVRDIIKFFLALRGNLEICGEASDGLEAVEKATESKPDLILLDFAMPNMNGAEAASVLKKRLPRTSIILFTMYNENIGEYLTSAIGVDAVLSKIDGMSALVNAVDAVLARASASQEN